MGLLRFRAVAAALNGFEINSTCTLALNTALDRIAQMTKLPKVLL